MKRISAALFVMVLTVLIGACERQDYKETRMFSRPTPHGHGESAAGHGAEGHGAESHAADKAHPAPEKH
jgi:hypothetical protein